MSIKDVVSMLLGGLLLGGAVWLLVHPTALRLEVNVSKRPYSFARVQLWFWSVVVIGCYIAAFWAADNSQVDLNGTSLALLGISGFTTAAARIVDTEPANLARPIEPLQMLSEGFVTDILSDDNGLSINRFQAAIMNVVIGAGFVVQMLELVRAGGPSVSFPHLDTDQLGLLGVSSATYLALKMRESPLPAAAAAPAPQLVATASPRLVTTDELPDLELDDNRDD